MSAQRDAIEMLRGEHKVVEELLARLRDLGERMLTGERVSPGTVRLGVGLLDAYLHRVHMRQFDVELWPEARVFANSGCEGTLEFVRDQHTKIRRSARELLELTSHWAEGDCAAQDEVARGLLDLAVADASINRYEEQHPFACLGSSLAGATRAHLGESFLGHAGTKGALEANIGRFLIASRTEE